MASKDTAAVEAKTSNWLPAHVIVEQFDKKRGAKKTPLKCPYQDSNLGRRGIALPQHDDLTTNLYGPKYKGTVEALDQLQQTCLCASRGGERHPLASITVAIPRATIGPNLV